MKVAVICPDAFTAWNFHSNLLKALREREYDVSVISAPVHDADVRHLQALGIRHIPLPFARFVSPRSDLRFLVDLYRILRTNRFDYVHSFNLKCHIYGTVVAWLARVPNVFGTIEGLGFTYTDTPGLRRRLLERTVDLLNALACRLADRVWFVNPDDLEFLAARKVAVRDKAVVVRGSGIDVEEFSASAADPIMLEQARSELALADDEPCVTMAVARAVWSKGVREFVEAADQLRSAYPRARFVLLAPVEQDSPQAVPPAYLRAAEQRNPRFVWLSTFRRDVREILLLSSVFTLPSYYREGLPNVLMEAMAMGKPIVTTDSVGCREVVEEGRNGFLVNVKDSNALAQALGRLLADRQLREHFGQRSRQKVVTEFGDSVVVGRVLSELYGVA
jgi:N,N'-diacetylbacillosaminyl-diphospho-undecaprenol alpha-1,3-N-acetylgalactosaminyltransferase